MLTSKLATTKPTAGVLVLLVAFLATLCAVPSAEAQDAEVYTLRNRYREATLGFHMTDHLKPVGTEGGNQRFVWISVTKPKGEPLFGSVKIHRFDCDSGEAQADCDDLGSVTNHAPKLKLRMATDKSRATLVGTIDLGYDVEIEIAMEEFHPPKLIRYRERTDQVDSFTIVQERKLEFDAKATGLLAGVELGNTKPGEPLISLSTALYSESRVRVTSNEATDDIPPDA